MEHHDELRVVRKLFLKFFEAQKRHLFAQNETEFDRTLYVLIWLIFALYLTSLRMMVPFHVVSLEGSLSQSYERKIGTFF